MNDHAPSGNQGATAALRLGPAAAGRCRRRVHLDHAPQAPRGELLMPDDGVKMRFADMQEHAERVLDLLPAPAIGWTTRSQDRPAVVRAPSLRTATRVGTPELLILDVAPDGGGGYLPVLVRGHRTLDPGGTVEVSTVTEPGRRFTDPTRRRRKHPMDLLQLAHHWTMLQELGLASSPPRGGVIGRGAPAQTDPVAAATRAGLGVLSSDDGEVVVWHDLTEVLADYAERFADRRAVAGAARSGGELARPSRIAECARCPWWVVCLPELEAGHDISLLAAGSDVDALHGAGLFTLDDLVAAPAQLVADLRLTSVRAGEARVKAKARLEGWPLVRRTSSVAARRADVELDVDMESYLEQGAYLWGTLLDGVDVGIPHGYRAFASFAPLVDGGAAIFAEFWAFLTEIRTRCADRGLSFAAYCWSRAAEERWMYGVPRTRPDVAGVPTEGDVRAFCTSGEWIDLFAEVKRQFVVTGSMRLKKVAPVAGFRWRDAAPGGENSMAWYRIAAGLDAPVDPEPGQPGIMRQRVLDYNEDDVRATAAIRHWMQDDARSLPTVAEVLAQIDVSV